MSYASVRSISFLSFIGAHLCMNCSLDSSNFLQEISSLSHSIVFLLYCLSFPFYCFPFVLPFFPILLFSFCIAFLSHSIVFLLYCLSFPFYCFPLFLLYCLSLGLLISLHWSLRKAFVSLLAILWNSAFKWIYLSFSPLPLASLLFTDICKTSSESFCLFAFLFLGDGLDHCLLYNVINLHP